MSTNKKSLAEMKDQIPLDVAASVRKSLLLEKGTPEEQRKALVDDVISAFENPNQWPLTDTERIILLRRWCSMAQTIRKTEASL